MNTSNQRSHFHQPMDTLPERHEVRAVSHDGSVRTTPKCDCADKMALCPPCGEAKRIANEKRRQDRRPDPVIYDTAEAQTMRLEADRRVRLVEQKLYQRYGRGARTLPALVVGQFLRELAISGL
ncbi:hypothetical protein EDC01DRAFT_630995 [Geopyxis carbonaria]|nr:hypothetical protein EDC01DRAFT_630995 [Geopyxis carbonaria]